MSRAAGQIYGYMHLPYRVELNARIRGRRQLERQIG